MTDDHTPQWLEQFRAGKYTLLNTDQPRRRSLESLPTTARQRLVESSGTPFAPGPAVRPVVEVMDGRKRNDEIEPADWRAALEATGGTVAVYFEVAADHEWWLAYDPVGEYDGYDGPFHLWSRYPTGAWNHVENTSGMLEMALENIYGEDDRDRECELYRSRVVCLEDAPAFVQRKVGGDT
ncbi:hypothetical protein Htur_5064 (plasmid) [Haloterrigena turkmenica DSM 5511]|uniref:Uncharacterized protein n=1 Tax=Haloterrigena turkmenica (strain ATCC 51198 / DSM 5511 / JCM 9101 / NCIMB 13204 / VKM B-1734 / 4k) TaxID=543526 RepID=D2S3K4_HALTV|nr:hypothetical protein [Haloterrigena turkmenica]ADB63951.1 hypothetical protein Htur_5064 [Haloterrigena turkmenica DSM 5511]